MTRLLRWVRIVYRRVEEPAGGRFAGGRIPAKHPYVVVAPRVVLGLLGASYDSPLTIDGDFTLTSALVGLPTLLQWLEDRPFARTYLDPSTSVAA